VYLYVTQQHIRACIYYTYTHIYVCVYMYVHINIYIYIYTHMHSYILIILQYKRTKCTFRKLIFQFLIFLCLLRVSNPRVHLQEDGCICSYGVVCCTCIGISSLVGRTVCSIYIYIYMYVYILRCTVQKTKFIHTYIHT
jgi:hypothetical protein